MKCSFLDFVISVVSFFGVEHRLFFHHTKTLRPYLNNSCYKHYLMLFKDESGGFSFSSPRSSEVFLHRVMYIAIKQKELAFYEFEFELTSSCFKNISPNSNSRQLDTNSNS